MSFFYIALEQIADDRRESIKTQAIATYGARSDDIEAFLKLFDKKQDTLKDNDHKSNMAMLNQKL